MWLLAITWPSRSVVATLLVRRSLPRMVEVDDADEWIESRHYRAI